MLLDFLGGDGSALSPASGSNHIGKDCRTYYVPGAQFARNPHQPSQDSHRVKADSHQASPDSHQVDEDSRQLLAAVPPDIRVRIPEVGSKPRREILRSLILELCKWRKLSAREIALILGGREQKPLVRDYLSPMVADGSLSYTIPEMEYHPDQRYTVAAKKDE